MNGEPIPLSVLELDLAPPSVGGWSVYLAGRGITVTVDDIGRPSITRAAARELITEHLEAAVRQREAAQAAERQAIEADRQRRAQLWGGIQASAIPDGVTPAAAMFAADHDTRPRRLTPLQEVLAGVSLVFHSIRDESADWTVGGGDG